MDRKLIKALIRDEVCGNCKGFTFKGVTKWCREFEREVTEWPYTCEGYEDKYIKTMGE